MITFRPPSLLTIAIVGNVIDVPGVVVTTTGGLLLALAFVMAASSFVIVIAVLGRCALRGSDPGRAGELLVEALRVLAHVFRRGQ
jgi:hypothetical protein